MQPSLYATERRGLRLTGLAAPPFGSALTSVMVFSMAPANAVTIGPLPLESWAGLETTAENGTSVNIRKRGVYQLDLVLQVPATEEVAAAITVGADASDLVVAVNPAVTVDGFEAAAHAQAPASTKIPLSLSTTLLVTDAMAGTAAATVRFVANDNDGGGTTTVGTPRARITYLGDLQGG